MPHHQLPLPSTARISAKYSQLDEGYNDRDSIILQSQCNCRQVILDITLPKDGQRRQNNVTVDDDFKVCNCHCVSCRRYHTTAYVSYLQLSNDRVTIRKGRDMIGKYLSSCQNQEGGERWHCKECASKILSVPAAVADVAVNSSRSWVNLGPLNDKMIPKSLANRWKEQLKQIENNLHTGNGCRWRDAVPSYDSSMSYSARRKMQLLEPKTLVGGCACGACQYKISLTRLTQLQHCYCHLCRELSGGPYMTWFPVNKGDFSWNEQCDDDDDPPNATLVRTTPFGSRHICNSCRGVLTIVYDSQPDLIWPCAGGLDDVSLPNENMGSLLSRVCHICCRHLPPWLDLPDDGMDRLDDAC